MERMDTLSQVHCHTESHGEHAENTENWQNNK
jgi:hypothetical protein